MTGPVKEPVLLLMCTVGPKDFCLRYFETVDGGQPNATPYIVQHFSDGKWRRLFEFPSFDAAVVAYETAVSGYETPWGKRTLPDHSIHSGVYIPEPPHGYHTTADTLMPVLFERAAA